MRPYPIINYGSIGEPVLPESQQPQVFRRRHAQISLSRPLAADEQLIHHACTVLAVPCIENIKPVPIFGNGFQLPSKLCGGCPQWLGRPYFISAEEDIIFLIQKRNAAGRMISQFKTDKLSSRQRDHIPGLDILRRIILREVNPLKALKRSCCPFMGFFRQKYQIKIAVIGGMVKMLMGVGDPGNR